MTNNNFAYLMAVADGLPGVSPAGDYAHLQEKLEPRMSQGKLDLGDGCYLSFVKDEQNTEVEMYHPESGFRRQVISFRGSDRPYSEWSRFEYLQSDGLIARSKRYGILRELLIRNFDEFPPRHEKERRMADKIAKLEAELAQARTTVMAIEAAIKSLNSRVESFRRVIRASAEALLSTKKAFRSSVVRQVREVLEDSLK